MYQPNFSITNKILKNTGIIEACREVIISAPLVPAWEAKFREEAIIRTVHHGTHIEGNELNISEAARVLQGQEVVGRERDIQEVMNYRSVLDFIEKLGLGRRLGGLRVASIKEGMEITQEDIKHIHKLTVERILPDEECGKYRTTQVVVKNSLTGEVTFRPPPAIEVPYLMEDFFEWLNSNHAQEVHSVLRAGIVQYELVRIHPFLDGNGRVARAVATLILFKEGYDIRKFFSLDEYYDKDAGRYYEALQSVDQRQQTKDNRQQDLTPWLEYFSEGLAVELTRVKEKVQRLSTDLHLKEKLGGHQIFLSERQIKIVEYIQKNGFLQNKAFPELFPMISEDTILRDIHDLMKKRIVRKKGKTKAAQYILR